MSISLALQVEPQTSLKRAMPSTLSIPFKQGICKYYFLSDLGPAFSSINVSETS